MFSKKETILFKAQQTVTKIIKITNNQATHLTSQQISEINTLTTKWHSLLPKDALPLPNFNNTSQTLDWHKNLLQWSKTYRHSFKLQTKTEQAKQITEAIIRREKAFESEKGNMIKNILKKQQNKIILDHIIENGEYFDDPNDIKNIVVDKAKIWTRKRNTAQILNTTWQTRYQSTSSKTIHLFL